MSGTYVNVPIVVPIIYFLYSEKTNSYFEARVI